MVTIPILKSAIAFSADLKMYFFRDAENGAPLATLSAQTALFVASRSLLETRLCSKYDHSGIKVAVLYHYCAVLLYYKNRWSRLPFWRRRYGVMVNSIANLIFFVAGYFFGKFYEKSLDNLCFALSMAILFLILVAIIRPRTDLGFCGFLIGATVPVAYNHFQLKVGFWIVFAICFLLLRFKSWLDKNWLEMEMTEVDNKFVLPISISASIKDSLGYPYSAHIQSKLAEVMVLYLFYGLMGGSVLLSGHCLNSECCASATEKHKWVAIYILSVFPAFIHGVYCSIQPGNWPNAPGETGHDVAGERNLRKQLARGGAVEAARESRLLGPVPAVGGDEVSSDGSSLEDPGSASQEERGVTNDTIRHMHSPDLSSVRVVHLVKFLPEKKNRIALDSAIYELVQRGMQREKAAESIYKKRCIPVNDGPSWAKYMFISGSPDDDEYNVIILHYFKVVLSSVDENREDHAAAFGDTIALECIARESKREIYVINYT